LRRSKKRHRRPAFFATRSAQPILKH